MGTTPKKPGIGRAPIHYGLIKSEMELYKIFNASFYSQEERVWVLNEYRAYHRDERLKDLQLIKLEKELSTPNKISATNKITFRNGIIRQGSNSHTFREKELELLFRYLWRRKAIITQNKVVVQEAKPVSKEAIKTETGITPGRLKTSVDSVNGALKRKGISVQIKMPSYVYLEIIQD